MARPKKESSPLTISMQKNVLEVLEQDSDKFGMAKGAYISQLIMQKHLEMVATGLLEKLTPEQIKGAMEKNSEEQQLSWEEHHRRIEEMEKKSKGASD